MGTKDTVFAMRISQKDKDELAKDAARNGRSVSNFITYLWHEWQHEEALNGRRNPTT
jgi:hypothetical protein